MTDHDALLAGIAADPNADLPRLVYADWLEENRPQDDQAMARAEWIRMTCGRDKTPAQRGKRTRVRGEQVWIRANARRLWPNLTGGGNDLIAVDFPATWCVCVVVKNFKTVRLWAERGVTTELMFPIEHAHLLADKCLLDEPHAKFHVRMNGRSYRGSYSGPGVPPRVDRIILSARPFVGELRGILDRVDGDVNRSSGSVTINAVHGFAHEITVANAVGRATKAWAADRVRVSLFPETGKDVS